MGRVRGKQHTRHYRYRYNCMRVCGCLLVFAQRTPHIQSSTNILQSRTFCCTFIRPIIYFVWALKLPLFWLCDNVFFSTSKKIDSLNIYLIAHSLYSECLPASDGFYVYSMLFLSVGVKWFHSLHSFIQNIKHLIVELTRYDAKCVTNMCSRSTYTVGGWGGGGGEPNSKHIKKRKPNNNYFHFCGNKLCVCFTDTRTIQSDLAQTLHCTAAVAAAAAAARTSTAHESIQDTLHTWIDATGFAYTNFTPCEFSMLSRQFRRSKKKCSFELWLRILENLCTRRLLGFGSAKNKFPQSHEIAF